jgi:hypothetical protein
MCEAVVEGMGGVWDRCFAVTDRATGRRRRWRLSWRGTPPGHTSPAATAFISRSLDHWAGGHGKWHGRFTHNDKHHIERRLATGVVMERKKREARAATRLPDAFYDTSAL